MSTQQDIFLSELELTLPQIIPRKKVSTLTGGLMTARYMANLDSKGLGPPDKVRVGKNICYTKKNFIAWLRLRCTT